MWEVGKTYADAAFEFDRSLLYTEQLADAIKQNDRKNSTFKALLSVFSSSISSDKGKRRCSNQKKSTWDCVHSHPFQV
jgi:hypothetical protein